MLLGTKMPKQNFDDKYRNVLNEIRISRVAQNNVALKRKIKSVVTGREDKYEEPFKTYHQDTLDAINEILKK